MTEQYLVSDQWKVVLMIEHRLETNQFKSRIRDDTKMISTWSSHALGATILQPCNISKFSSWAPFYSLSINQSKASAQLRHDDIGKNKHQNIQDHLQSTIISCTYSFESKSLLDLRAFHRVFSRTHSRVRIAQEFLNSHTDALIRWPKLAISNCLHLKLNGRKNFFGMEERYNGFFCSKPVLAFSNALSPHPDTILLTITEKFFLEPIHAQEIMKKGTSGTHTSCYRDKMEITNHSPPLDSA